MTVKLFYSFSRIQPSSTTLGVNVTLSGGDSVYIDVSEVNIPAEAEFLERLLNAVEEGKEIEAVEVWEGEFRGLVEPPASIKSYLVVAHPERAACPVCCPWCYAGRFSSSARDYTYEAISRLARVVAELVKKLPGTVSIVFGGCTDPATCISSVESFYKELLGIQVKKSAYDWRVYFAVSTSVPVWHKEYAMLDAVAVTVLPNEFIEIHPVWRRLGGNTYMAMLESFIRQGSAAGVDVILTYILTEETATLFHVNMLARLFRLGASRLFILSYHPTIKHFAPPTPRTILAFLKALVERGISLSNIMIDLCSLKRLAPRAAGELTKRETEQMWRCTENGCERASVCPRGGRECVAVRN